MSSLISFLDFKEKSQNTKNFIISKKLSIDLDTIISIYLKLSSFSNYSLLFESADNINKGRYSVIALSPDLQWVCNDSNVKITNNDEVLSSSKMTNQEIINSLEDFIKLSELPKDNELPPICSGIFGYMNYDMVKYFENIPAHKNTEIDIPEAQFIRPQILIVFDNLRDEIIINMPIWVGEKDIKELYDEKTSLFNQIIKIIKSPLKSQDEKSHIEQEKDIKFTSNFSSAEYEAIVKKAKEYIVSGDVFQVLPSRRFYGNFPYKGFSFYRSLRNLNPSPFLFYLNFDSFEIIGSSPEIMVKVNKDDVIIKPLAGTRKRGANAEEDHALSKELLNDEKERAEHLMLIDLGRNDVGRVSKDHSVEVTKFMEIEYYSHVMHISSTVEGKLSDDKSCLDALIAGFPPGTVSGAPKIRAMQIISELEPIKRSFYSGCVGYFSLHQNYMDMAIMLRTALLKNKTLYLQSGAGIVYDSVPHLEYEETSNKAKVLIAAAKNTSNFLY